MKHGVGGWSSIDFRKDGVGSLKRNVRPDGLVGRKDQGKSNREIEVA